MWFSEARAASGEKIAARKEKEVGKSKAVRGFQSARSSKHVSFDSEGISSCRSGRNSFLSSDIDVICVGNSEYFLYNITTNIFFKHLFI